MGETCNTCGGAASEYRILVGNWMEREFFEDPGIDGSIILKWMEHGLE